MDRIRLTERAEMVAVDVEPQTKRVPSTGLPTRVVGVGVDRARSAVATEDRALS